MALPKLETPKFDTVLPTTGKRINYRPFLVKEHKLLMMMQDGDVEDVTRIVEELVDTCTFGEVNAKKLSSTDIEWLFLKIRSKSIGENYEFIIPCNSCQKQIDTEVSIETITVEKTEGHADRVLITESIGIDMRYPTFKEILDLYKDQTPDKALDLILRCVKAVYTPDSYTEIDENNKQELVELVESMNKEQFDKLENFFNTMPKLVQKVDAVCPACNAKNHVEIKGLENFFA